MACVEVAPSDGTLRLTVRTLAGDEVRLDVPADSRAADVKSIACSRFGRKACSTHLLAGVQQLADDAGVREFSETGTCNTSAESVAPQLCLVTDSLTRVRRMVWAEFCVAAGMWAPSATARWHECEDTVSLDSEKVMGDQMDVIRACGTSSALRSALNGGVEDSSANEADEMRTEIRVFAPPVDFEWDQLEKHSLEEMDHLTAGELFGPLERTLVVKVLYFSCGP